MAKTLLHVWILFMALSNVSAASAAEPVNVRLDTDFGHIVISLDREKAPETVKNFLGYVEDGFFDGLIFHRVIKGFMIQGGGFTPDMKQKKSGSPIRNEADNGLKNDRGAIAMARTSDPHSATSQFFINTVDNAFLNHKSKTGQGWGYCVFGKITEGLDVLDKIESVTTGSKGGHRDVPKEPVTIIKARVIAP